MVGLTNNTLVESKLYNSRTYKPFKKIFVPLEWGLNLLQNTIKDENLLDWAI